MINFKAVALLLFSAVLFSCHKDVRQSSIEPDKGSKTVFTAGLEGSYSGTFTRTAGNAANSVSSNVILSFHNGKFTGTSTLSQYPAICSGTYAAVSNKLQVNNACFFTANFDWTYIFTGEYQYTKEGNQLRIWRAYNEDVRDVYVLTKD